MISEIADIGLTAYCAMLFACAILLSCNYIANKVCKHEVPIEHIEGFSIANSEDSIMDIIKDKANLRQVITYIEHTIGIVIIFIGLAALTFYEPTKRPIDDLDLVDWFASNGQVWHNYLSSKLNLFIGLI